MTDTKEAAPKWVPYVPRGFEDPAVDVIDALRRGKAVLVEEEDRWVQGAWFNNRHPEVDPEDPFCNSWRVCAEGAVLVVTVGVARATAIPNARDFGGATCPWVGVPGKYEHRHYGVDEEQCRLYEEAKRLLAHVGRRISYWKLGQESASAAHSYNDSFFETRTDVLRWFDETIEHAIAQREECTP